MSKNINQDKVDPKLLEILVCPVTKSDLQYDSKNNELISKQAGSVSNSRWNTNNAWRGSKKNYR